jgi:selenocysteine lyase/cysteine desulfurase
MREKTMPFTSYRNEFPFTVNRIYLNHAAVAPLSTDVREKMDWFINNRSFGEIDFFEDINDIHVQTRASLAGLINGKKENVAITSNASEGLNHLARGLKWKKGDQIILSNIESPANVYPLMNLQEQGVELVFIKSKKGCINVDDVEKAITPRTRMLAISFVEFFSGFRNDMLALGALCKKDVRGWVPFRWM